VDDVAREVGVAVKQRLHVGKRFDLTAGIG